MTDDPRTVTINEACELVKVSRRTIYLWLARGRIRYKRTAGGRVRIFTESLWTDARPVAPNNLTRGGSHAKNQ